MKTIDSMQQNLKLLIYLYGLICRVLPIGLGVNIIVCNILVPNLLSMVEKIYVQFDLVYNVIN